MTTGWERDNLWSVATKPGTFNDSKKLLIALILCPSAIAPDSLIFNSNKLGSRRYQRCHRMTKDLISVRSLGIASLGIKYKGKSKFTLTFAAISRWDSRKVPHN